MKSMALVCALAIIASIYVVVETQLVETVELEWHKHSLIGCRGRHMQIRNLIQEIQCKPRYSLIKLIPPSGYVYYPDYVPVMRCNGNCPKSMSCRPAVITTKKIAVRMDGFESRNCYHVSVEEHLECKCDCSVQKEHCSPYQVYIEDNCACECKERQECDKSYQMVWDEKLCKCTCSQEEEICSSGLAWVPSLCGCAKVMTMPSYVQNNEE